LNIHCTPACLIEVSHMQMCRRASGLLVVSLSFAFVLWMCLPHMPVVASSSLYQSTSVPVEQRVPADNVSGTPIRIFVVSFIHSGSSALTGLLERSGAFVFHDDLSRARRNKLSTGPTNAEVLNKKGYFERRWLTEYDNTLLVMLGSGGTNTCPLIPWLRGIPQPDGTWRDKRSATVGGES